jgi:DNA polymerase-3 subunit epsilon
MNNVDWVIIDVETSGASTGDRVIELGIIEMKGWRPVGRGRSWLINHDIEISYRAQAVHGISREMLSRNGINPRQALREITRFIDGRMYGAHSIACEKRVIASDFQFYRVGPPPMPCICTLKMSRMFVGPSGNGLDRLAQRFRLRNKPSHRALADAKATAEFAHKVLSRKVDVQDFDLLVQLNSLPMAHARRLYDDIRSNKV